MTGRFALPVRVVNTLLPILFVPLLTARPLCAAETAVEVAWALGHRVSVESPALRRAVTLLVHLPEDYQKSRSSYPVLYILGAEDRARFAVACAQVEALTGAGQVPPMILVGIDLPEGNGVLIPRSEGADGTASADAHLRALIEDVVPHIERSYRTAEYRILYGASNAGLFAVYALLQRPQSFQATVASSPMLGWSKDLIAGRAQAAFGLERVSRRFLYLIYSDDDYEEVRDQVPAFVSLLRERAPAWLEWHHTVRHNAGHVPVIDLPLALGALFPDYNPEVEPATLAALSAHYQTLASRYAFPVPVPSEKLFDMGISRFQAKRLDEAEQIFRVAAEQYPWLAQGEIGLGLVARDRGDRVAAMSRFKKALEIDPESALARRLLARLEGAQQP
jgi:predicted alpha/beta superfamily hydrolase